MIGSQNSTSTPGLGASGTIAAAINQQSAGTSATVNAQYAALNSPSIQGAVYVLLILAAIWVAWGVLVHHTNLGERLNPANIAPNWHNWLHIGLVASIFIVGMKILTTKATAWGIPGAEYLAQFWAAT